MNIVSSSLMRIVFNGIILFQAAMVFGEVVNLIQGHDALIQAHYLLSHHLHELPNESVNAGCSIMLCMGLHMADSFFLQVHTFTSHNASDKVS